MNLKKQVVGHYKRFRTLYICLFAIFLVASIPGVLSDAESPGELLMCLLLLGVLALLFVVPIVILSVLMKSGKWTAPFDAYYDALDEAGKERFEQELERADRMTHAYLTSDCVVVANKGNLNVVPYRDIVWISGNAVSIYFWTSRFLVLMTRQKTRVNIVLEKHEDLEVVNHFIGKIREKRPGVLSGNSALLTKMFQENFDDMVLLSDREPDAEKV